MQILSVIKTQSELANGEASRRSIKTVPAGVLSDLYFLLYLLYLHAFAPGFIGSGYFSGNFYHLAVQLAEFSF